MYNQADKKDRRKIRVICGKSSVTHVGKHGSGRVAIRSDGRKPSQLCGLEPREKEKWELFLNCPEYLRRTRSQWNLGGMPDTLDDVAIGAVNVEIEAETKEKPETLAIQIARRHSGWWKKKKGSGIGDRMLQSMEGKNKRK